MKQCECGEPLPEIGVYGVLEHVCQRCGRERKVRGAGIELKVPPGAERIEELEREVEQLSVMVSRIAPMVLR